VDAPAPRAVNTRHRLEYGALRVATGALRTLSFRRASDLGAALGRLGYEPLGVRRAVVERQIAAAFPEWTFEKVQATARASYENLGRTTIEGAIIDRFDAAEVRSLFEEPPHWHLVEDALSKGRGCVMLAGHLGSWEIAGAYLRARGVRIAAVARQMENPLFDAWITRARQRTGIEIIPDAEAVRRVPRILRRNGSVVFLFDQGAAGMASTWVKFFGRWAKTPRGPAVFALRFGAPALFGGPLRRPDGRFDLPIEEIPVQDTGDLDADVDRIVASYSAALERLVRRAPEQYFWQHRRWKHQRPGTPPEQGDPLA
jgi:KDO2-lipid IV(A) lauroyltransferase